MAIDQNDLIRAYADKSDEELLELYSSGTLSELAYEVLQSETTKRNLTLPKKPEEKHVSIETFPSTNITTNYGTAKLLSSVIVFIGWLMFGIGLILAVSTYLTTNVHISLTVATTLPFVGIAIAGLAFIITGQLLRATVDTADATREILIHLTNNK